MKNSGIIMIFIIFILVVGYIIVYNNVIPDKSNKIDQVESAIITSPASNQNLAFAKNKVSPLKFKWDKRCLATGRTTRRRTPANVGPRWPSGFV